ncbi:prepilin-type N-terminal cleavage/methylation domain-containing protein [Candidatus Wolfebacteria bacterium]|nr:prepilin-type N-terminal cleavage/methylation domain-containing protein [Candidatus Wolfebacteria bacterium]
MKGFTLIELILVIGILGILGGIGFGVYYNFQTNVKVEEEANKIVEILRGTQQKAISGENLNQWGIRFVNSTSSQYYDVFEGGNYLTGTSTERNYLPESVIFINPSTSSTIDTIFNIRSGNAATSSNIIITITSSVSSSTKNITITPRGLISRD